MDQTFVNAMLGMVQAMEERMRGLARNHGAAKFERDMAALARDLGRVRALAADTDDDTSDDTDDDAGASVDTRLLHRDPDVYRSYEYVPRRDGLGWDAPDPYAGSPVLYATRVHENRHVLQHDAVAGFVATGHGTMRVRARYPSQDLLGMLLHRTTDLEYQVRVGPGRVVPAGPGNTMLPLMTCHGYPRVSYEWTPDDPADRAPVHVVYATLPSLTEFYLTYLSQNGNGWVAVADPINGLTCDGVPLTHLHYYRHSVGPVAFGAFPTRLPDLRSWTPTDDEKAMAWREFWDRSRQEFVARTWHPSRVLTWCDTDLAADLAHLA